MCGICGIVHGRDVEQRAPSTERLMRMLGRLAHRGPDDEGIEISSRAFLGATRLAIRGVASGHQPLVDRTSGIVVVCNGEIDNHEELRAWLIERGHTISQASDVAVIPGLYLELGEAFVERIIGAFALAIWDPRTSRLLLARDRAGERPLFYVESQGSVIFATEIGALSDDPLLALHADRESLTGYLQSGYFASPSTPFEGARKVAAGTILTFDESGRHSRRYWRWDIASRPKRTPSREEFDSIFRRAVWRQSEADVQRGVFLSGGLDSSLVAAVVKDLRPDSSLMAYTLRFREASYDEGDSAARVADHLGIESVAVWVEPGEIPQQLRELIAIVGEPLADPAWIPTAMLAGRASQDVKLALVGEGADELFGGYPTYIGAWVASAWGRLPSSVQRALAAIVRRLPASEKKVTLASLLKRFLDGVEIEGLERHRLWTASLSPALLRRLECDPPADSRAHAEEGLLLDLLQRADLEGPLAEGLLTKADRASMRSALELRAPFLDRDVMEFAATLPAQERVRGFGTKVFLKRHAARYLPDSIIHRRKRGLSVPIAGWLRGPLHDWARERLDDDCLAIAGVRRAAAVELLDEHTRRVADHGRALWTLIVLSEWLRWSEECSAEPLRSAYELPRPVREREVTESSSARSDSPANPPRVLGAVSSEDLARPS